MSSKRIYLCVFNDYVKVAALYVNNR